MKNNLDTREVHGVIYHRPSLERRTDYLYRVSVKCFIRNNKGEVLVVKETGRDWWDLPGGGMDHGESIYSALAREMNEEVRMTGDFTYSIINVEEPDLLVHNFWQIRLIFEVFPDSVRFEPGDDGDEIAFKNPVEFKDSPRDSERRIYHHSLRASSVV